MSDSTTHPAGTLILADRPPEAWREVWAHSTRPRSGVLIRAGISSGLILVALLVVPPGPPFWIALTVAALAFVATPLFIQGALARREREVLAADQGRAGELLASLPTQALVRHFAPHAWLPLQQGRLHLLRGDGAQADKELAEVARLTSDAQRPELLAIRAQAQVLAGEHTKAHQFLSALKGKSELRPHDQLALGIALLHTRNKPEEASEHIEAAREVLGGHPRVLAGLAYARARAGDAVAASELLERAQEVLDDETHHDEVVADLVRRTEKALRAFRKTEAKRGRKRDRRRRGADAQQGRAETEVVAAEPRSESADANTAGPEEAKATEAEEPHARKIQEAKAKAATEEVREAAKEAAK
ncbi:MAG: hypothetical protein KC468_33715, partial [Myxococcales bacterium]|nr:hypothetical protein [Myxococcales bacterium]